MTTHQRIEVGTPAGKAALRRIARGKSSEWYLVAGDSTQWKLRFVRRIDGKIGEPDQTVEIDTDLHVSREGERGVVRGSSDSEEVIIPEATAASLFGTDVCTVAQFISEGWRLSVEHSSGSITSSKHGLAFRRLCLNRVDKCGRWDTVDVGATNVLINGTTVVGGAVQ